MHQGPDHHRKEVNQIHRDALSVSAGPAGIARCLHLLYCKNVQVRGVVFDARNPNNDGIDPESSEYVLIEDIEFNNIDDNIAVKSGRDLEARTLTGLRGTL